MLMPSGSWKNQTKIISGEEKKPTFFKPKIISTNKSSNTILDTIKESQAQTEIT